MIVEMEHLIICLKPTDRHCCFCSMLTTFGGKLRRLGFLRVWGGGRNFETLDRHSIYVKVVKL